MMPEVAKDLGVKYINNGSMVIGFSKEDEETIKELYERGIKNGVEKLEILTGDEARKIEPNLSEKVTCVLHAKTGSIICPYELTIAAVGNAMDNGVELKTNFEVTSINKKDEGYVICSSNEEVNTKYVINCAGINSDKIARMIGDESFSVHPRRGDKITCNQKSDNYSSNKF